MAKRNQTYRVDAQYTNTSGEVFSVTTLKNEGTLDECIEYVKGWMPLTAARQMISHNESFTAALVMQTNGEVNWFTTLYVEKFD
jgi:hypothetical protein